MFTFMDAARVKPALSTNPPSEVDPLSSLPDCLIFQIFLNLPTKDVVQTSALSTRWTTLWKDVHGLDLDTEDFNTHETFVSFVDNFLERNRGSSIHLFKVTYDSSYKPDLVNRWVDTAVRLKVEHLDISDDLPAQDIMMNPTLKLMLPCLNMVRDFLVGISKVKDLTIASSTLEVIYDYARYVQLPVFRNLYTLCVRFNSYMWEMLPVFLEVCPNLKTLVVGTTENPKMVDLTVIARPWNLLSSLEHVGIERPLKGEALEMALVGYLLENSPNLKKLSLSLHDSLKKGKSKEESDVFIELLNFPRLSSSCQIIVR
ncbi:BnaCnng66580D [Brassica napus]|uniref:BnaCnng66580D protein n=1 Tax=Brassica napus TaxID=3708 RepID=A0A078JUE4_BRANA|nr:BnaCnng66580D [Brassica napus]